MEFPARPFALPSDRILPRDMLGRTIARAVVLQAKALVESTRIDALAQQIYPRDEAPALLAKGSTSPATIATGTWAGQFSPDVVADLPIGLAPGSAAAELIARGLRVSLDHAGGVLIPNRIVLASDAGGFLGEGAPISVRHLDLATGALLEPAKIAVIVAYTEELTQRAAQDFEAVIRQMLSEAAALALDAAIFSTTAASAGVRPAGILFGQAGIVAAAGGGQAALAGDVEAIINALAAAGGGRDVIFVGAPGTIGAVKTWAPARFDYPLLASSAIAAGTLIGIEASSFVSAFGAVPELSVSREAVLHMEDTTPLAIGTVGSPATVAAPARSLWQTQCLATRMLLRASWAMRASGHAQHVTAATW